MSTNNDMAAERYDPEHQRTLAEREARREQMHSERARLIGASVLRPSLSVPYWSDELFALRARDRVRLSVEDKLLGGLIYQLRVDGPCDSLKTLLLAIERGLCTDDLLRAAGLVEPRPDGAGFRAIALSRWPESLRLRIARRGPAASPPPLPPTDGGSNPPGTGGDGLGVRVS